MVKFKPSQPRYAIFLLLAVCFIVGVLPQVSAFDWDDGLVSYYKLNDNAANINVNDSTNNNEGTLAGGDNTEDLSVAGKINTSLDFNGVDDYVNIRKMGTFGSNMDNGVSYSAWVKSTMTTSVQNGVITGVGAGVTLFTIDFLGVTGKIGCSFRDEAGKGIFSSTTNNVLWNDGEWHLVIVTVNGNTNTVTVTIDNVNKDITYTAQSTPDNFADFDCDFLIGAMNNRGTPTGFFDGVIDEVGIWNKTLNSSEISELWNSGDGLGFIGETTEAVNIELTSPINGTIISDTGANFTALFNIIGSTNYTWKNATYYVWKNGDIFNTTTISISGNSTNYTQNIDSFTLADYEWDVLGWYGNDTYNNYTWSSNGNFTLTVGATIDSQSYDNETYETADDTFKVNITLLSGVVLQAAYVYYDNIRYIGTITNLGSNKYSIIKTLSVPLIDGGSENRSFYWSFVYTSPIQKTQNTTTLNQTVSPLFLGLCNATYTTHALDIDIKEEGTFDDLNGTLEFSADYWLGDGTVKKPFTFSYLENDINSYDFCIFPNKTFYIDDIISYTATDYERRDYFLTNAELSNATMNLSLYLATTTTTDIFTVTVQDENSNPIEGAFINVQRWDIGTNNFYTIGVIKTTSDGTGIINMRLNDAWYRFQVNYNNKLYLTTEPRKESGTSRILNINLVAANPYNEFRNIDYSLIYDEDTNITSFIYSDTTGSVATACLRVLKLEGDGNTEVYYSCVQSTSSVLTYKIEEDGTYIIRAIFRLTSEYDSVEQVVDEIIRQGTSERFVIIGKFGQVISLILIGTAATFGIAIGSIPLGLGLIGISLVLVYLMGWLNIAGSVLYGLISIIILIAINLRRGR